jgi:hypothetical protein
MMHLHPGVGAPDILTKRGITMELIILVLNVTFSVAVGMAAARRYRRSGFGWGVLSFFISPLLGWLLLLLLGPKPLLKAQPQPVVNWSAIDWTAGEIAKPRPVVQPAAIEPLSPAIMWVSLTVLGLILVGFIIAAVVGA